MNACIVVNPTAGRGRAARILSEVQRAFEGIGVNTLFETKSPGDEERVTVAALESGFTTIVVVGGDGTCSRVAGTLLAQNKRASLALVPVGTGNDFAKTLGVIGCSATDVANLVASDEPATIDVGIADGNYFLNSCGFGFDASVLEATQSVRFLKGDSVYIWSALKQLFTYRGQNITVTTDGQTTAHTLLMLTVSNGQHLGGAFRIAPGAVATDGLLDVGLFSDASVLDRIRIFAAAFRGTHQRLSSVEARRANAVELTFRNPPMMEVDGELRLARSTTVRIECVPRVLSVIAAPGAGLSV
jgi:diacylglycerol kinase (ATP)